MPDVKVYTPRKVTPQNEDTLPSDHDETKRISYMQVTLSENEMKEAVRNYVRGQIPIQEGDEMPVVFVAGRGDNGHSAQITIQAATIVVESPERPSDAVPTYDEANKAAAARNASLEEQSEPEAPSEPEETEEAEELEAPEAEPEEPSEEPEAEEETPFVEDEPETEQPEQVEEAEDPLAEVEDARDEAPKRKASSLFGGSPAPAAEPTAETAPAQKPKSKSIFDNL